MKTKTKGPFRQEENKKWMIDTKVKIDGEYVHLKKRGYSTLTEAKDDFERAKAELIKNKSKHCKTMFIEELVDEFLKDQSINLESTTVYLKMCIFNKYFIPKFKNQLIEAVFKLHIMKEFSKDLYAREDISTARKNKISSVIKELLKYSYQHKYIDAEYYQDCDIQFRSLKVSRKASTQNRVAWTNDEIKAFFSVIDKESMDYVMFYIFLNSAPRLGEFLGLQVKSYDRENKILKIQAQFAYDPFKKKSELKDELKTDDSNREIIMDDYSASLLEDYIDTLGLKSEDFLFSYDISHRIPVSRSTFRRRLYEYEDIAKVRKNVPHGIRHTVATILAGACTNAQDIEAAAKRLGHSPEMFLNTYGAHNTQESEKKLLKKLSFLS